MRNVQHRRYDRRVDIAEHAAAHLEETLAESVRVAPQLLDLPRAEISADLAGDHAQRGERLFIITHVNYVSLGIADLAGDRSSSALACAAAGGDMAGAYRHAAAWRRNELTSSDDPAM